MHVISKKYTNGGFAFLFSMGKLYITGGRGPIDSRWITSQMLDARQTGKIKTPPMVGARNTRAAVTAGPFVFAFGAWNGRNRLLSSCEVYNFIYFNKLNAHVHQMHVSLPIRHFTSGKSCMLYKPMCLA